jgi:hypothetical protein
MSYSVITRMLLLVNRLELDRKLATKIGLLKSSIDLSTIFLNFVKSDRAVPYSEPW